MPKRIRSFRDAVRHRRIVRSNPLARIPEIVLTEGDVYHCAPQRAAAAVDGGPGALRRRLAIVG